MSQPKRQEKKIMWVIANGAPKTGSTWPVQLLNATKQFERIPSHLQNPKWTNSSVCGDITNASIYALASSRDRYLSKQHWFNRRKSLLSISGIKIINSIRDIRDTFVSRYYHDVRLNHVKCHINEYLQSMGDNFVYRYCAYQRYWIEAAKMHPNSYFIASYERLSNDYVSSARDLFTFCELRLESDEFAHAVEFGRFKKPQISGPGKFFRKGKVHTFSDDLSEEAVAFLMELSASHGLREIKNQDCLIQPGTKAFPRDDRYRSLIAATLEQ